MNYAEVVKTIESRGKESFTVSDPADGICPVCRGTGWEEVEIDAPIYGDGAKQIAVRPCTACGGNHARKVSDALTVADIPEDRRLSDFDWSLYGGDMTREKKIVDQLVERFRDFEREGMGLFITSRTRGSGKTYLASAVGGELINRYEASVRFVSASNLIEISKQKRDDGGDPLDGLISCRVLIIDDLGQQRTGRDWLTDILFRIIDARYQAKKIVIVTSNVALAELDFDDRVVDRLNAMTFTVKIPEVCIRARDANTRKRAILQKLGIE